jgi:hypothetical protein
MRIRSAAVHAAQLLAEGSLLAFLVVALVAGTALAGKPVGGGGKPAPSGSSLTLVMVSDQNADSLPNWADSITWNVSTTATTGPNVSVACYQGGTLVYSAAAGYFDGYKWPEAKIMTLKSPSWTGGAADCTARLYKITTKGTTTLATSSFHVSP